MGSTNRLKSAAAYWPFCNCLNDVLVCCIGSLLLDWGKLLEVCCGPCCNCWSAAVLIFFFWRLKDQAQVSMEVEGSGSSLNGGCMV